MALLFVFVLVTVSIMLPLVMKNNESYYNDDDDDDWEEEDAC